MFNIKSKLSHTWESILKDLRANPEAWTFTFIIFFLIVNTGGWVIHNTIYSRQAIEFEWKESPTYESYCITYSKITNILADQKLYSGTSSTVFYIYYEDGGVRAVSSLGKSKIGDSGCSELGYIQYSNH